MRGIALVPVDHLLTPVAEDISLQIRRSLRPVVAHRMPHFAEMFSVAQRQRYRLLSVPFLQIRSKMRSTTVGKQFVLQVTIPVDSEVHRRHLGWIVSNHFSMTIPYFLTVQAPHFKAPMPPVNIRSHTPSGIISIQRTVENLASTGIPIIRTIRPLFVYHKDFQPRSVWVEIREMERITMAEPRRVQQTSIVIDRSRAISNLVASITIHISYCQAVGALCKGRRREPMRLLDYLAFAIHHHPVVRSERSMQPLRRQLFTIEIHCPEIRTGVVSSAHHGTRPMGSSIKISHASEVSFATVAIVVLIAPNRRISRKSISLKSFTLSHLSSHTESSVRIIPDGMHRLSRFAIEDSEQFRTILDAPPTVAIISRIIERTNLCISSRFANKPALSIDTSSRSLANHFRLSIAIKVENQELGIVGTGTDILAKIDAPELCSVEFITIKNHIASIAIVGIVVRVGRVPFHYQFILTVTIHVAHATVVRSVGIDPAIWSSSTLRTVDGQRLIQISPRLHWFRNLPLHRGIHLRLILITDQAIRMCRRAFYISKVGCPDMMSNHFSIPLYIKTDILAIRTEESPTEIDSLSGSRQSHQSTVEAFHREL